MSRMNSICQFLNKFCLVRKSVVNNEIIFFWSEIAYFMYETDLTIYKLYIYKYKYKKFMLGG